MLPFFPRDILDEIWDLIEIVSEGFPTYFCLLFAASRVHSVNMNAEFSEQHPDVKPFCSLDWVDNWVVLLFYFHGKQLWSCQDGQLT